jgi:hypothetical protein
MDLTPSPLSPSEEERAAAQQPVSPPDADPAAVAPAGDKSTLITLSRATARRTGKEIGGKKFRVGSGDDYVPFRSRTRRRRRLIVTSVVAGLLLAAGGYSVVSLLSSPAQAPRASGCPGRTNAASTARKVQAQLPTAAQVKLNVYNSTQRHGLAATTAAQLKQRGFTIAKVTNDPLKAKLTAPAQIRGATGSAPAMSVVAAEVTGSQILTDNRTDGSVDLVLGTGYTALASPDQVSAALKAASVTPARTTGSGCTG